MVLRLTLDFYIHYFINLHSQHHIFIDGKGMKDVAYKRKLSRSRHPRLFSIIHYESRNLESSVIEQFILDDSENDL